MLDPCLAKDGSVIHYTTMQPNQRIAFFLPVGFVLLRQIRHSACFIQLLAKAADAGG
jgi:hypothetical protein